MGANREFDIFRFNNKSHEEIYRKILNRVSLNS